MAQRLAPAATQPDVRRYPREGWHVSLRDSAFLEAWYDCAVQRRRTDRM